MFRRICTLLAGGLVLTMAAPGGASAEPTPKKWHPGHYFNAYPHQLHDEDWNSRIKGSRIMGVTLRYGWRELESERGVYDFSAIRRQLERAARDDKYIGLHVEDRSWGDGAGKDRCVPDYLTTAAFGNGQMLVTKPDGRASGCIAARWDAATVGRYIALMQALAAEFDTHPRLAWVQTTESAVSMGGPKLAPYQAALDAQYLHLADAMGDTWHRTPWGLSINHSLSNYQKLTERVMAAGGGLTWPDSTPLSCTRCYHSPIHEVARAFAGRLPIMPSVEPSRLIVKDHPFRDGYDCGGHPCTWDDLLSQLQAWQSSIIQWPLKVFGAGADDWDWQRDIGSRLDKIQWAVNTKCPGNMRCE